MLAPLPFVTNLLRHASRVGAVTLCAVVLSAAPARAADDADEIPLHGTWTVETWSFRDDGRPGSSLELSWKRGHDHWGSRSIDPARAQVLTPEQLAGKTTVVHFSIRRDAGTFVCDGHVGNGSGAGLYELQLDPSYADRLAQRGIGRPDRAQQIRLALSDMSFEFLDELEKQHYPKPGLELLINMCNHGVDREYVTGMGTLGYKFDSIDELLHARDHGVDPRYVLSMKEAGFRPLSLEELIRTRDQGVDGRYVHDMAEAGYKKVTLEDLVRARQHGVDARVAKRINARLSEPAPLDRLIQIHDRGGLD